MLPGNIIRIGNIAASSPSSAWVIQFRAKITSTTFVFAFSMNYRWFTTVWNTFAVWTFNSNPTISFGYSSFTSTAAQISRFYPNYSERSSTYIRPGTSTIKETNIEITPSIALPAGSTYTLAFSDTTNPFIDPGANTLYCFYQLKINVMSYGFPWLTTCTFSAGVFTLTIPPNINIAAATTFLITGSKLK